MKIEEGYKMRTERASVLDISKGDYKIRMVRSII